jgi:uncharacterized protein YjbI with pentapeptide repeats
VTDLLEAYRKFIRNSSLFGFIRQLINGIEGVNRQCRAGLCLLSSTYVAKTTLLPPELGLVQGESEGLVKIPMRKLYPRWTTRKVDRQCNCDTEGSPYELRSACKHLIPEHKYEEEWYCILHLPSEDKGDEFERALGQKLDAGDFNLRGVWFPSTFDLKKFGFDQEASLTNEKDFFKATFRGKVDFSKTAFKEKINFSRVTFGGEANFSDVSFDEEAFFRAASFKGSAEFAWVDFKRSAFFFGATFDKGSFFHSTRFGSRAEFSGTIFRKDSDLSYANFAQEAYFREALFQGDAHFFGGSFDRAADFTNAAFQGEARFQTSAFKNPAYFHGARFGGSCARLSNASFSDEADFRETYVRQADFRGTTFSKPVDFREATFQKADFRYSTFEDSVNFREASFSDEANFHNSTFKSGAAFRGSDDRPFYSTMLRPSWFVNVDARNIDFTNVRWYGLSPEHKGKLGDELQALNTRDLRGRSPHLLMAETCRDLAFNFGEGQRYDEASAARYWSIEALRRDAWAGHKALRNLASKIRLTQSIHWALSGYGERPIHAFLVLVGMWVVFALLYLLVGTAHTGNSSLPSECLWQIWSACFWEPAGEALGYSLGALTLQVQDSVDSAIGLAPTLVYVEGILGPLQIALLLLAARRRFMQQ